MRLWSLHPRLLDTKGFLGCWRETLLAKKVLLGETRGYKHHPQLDRFKAQPDPLAAIDTYMYILWVEGLLIRKYNLSRSPLTNSMLLKADTLWEQHRRSIPVTTGQLIFEKGHLTDKILKRTGQTISINIMLDLHPLFHPVLNPQLEPWEMGLQLS